MKFWIAIWAVSIAVVGVGCSTVRVIPADMEVRYLKEGERVTAPPGGLWLVPPARMRQILMGLSGE